jgi:ABC-type branched-subunit amino acid transport system ATPase component
MLEVDNIYAERGGKSLLSGVSLKVARGEIVALLGASGSGRTALLDAIGGLVPVAGGAMRLNGQDLEPTTAGRIRQGVGFVRAAGTEFRGLSAEEHLLVAARPGPFTPLQIYNVFPSLRPLRHRPPASLARAERRMLAIGQALVGNARLLLIDAATEGLEREPRHQILDVLRRLRDRGYGILVVDTCLEELRFLADRFLVMADGRIVTEVDRVHNLLSPASLARALGV